MEIFRQPLVPGELPSTYQYSFYNPIPTSILIGTKTSHINSETSSWLQQVSFSLGS